MIACIYGLYESQLSIICIAGSSYANAKSYLCKQCLLDNLISMSTLSVGKPAHTILLKLDFVLIKTHIWSQKLKF